ncbi:hypothetical protein GCM10022204_19250 [Microlunatus aurantiacus]|uniref:TolA protein n=1 Tax=Microlunatus aurantiacus TaxID=446786 RepID=A0ABP7DBV5_9ACTN
MAQQQNKQNRPKQPQDPYAQKAKELASAVQRLRGWVGSDPSRTPELADALVALTEHRLLGHAYTVAAPEAQEAVKLAAQQLTANGPIGPYTSVADASRYVTAVVHLGVIQAAAGLPEAAAETIRSFADLREQLGSLPLAEALAPATVVWALACTARGALAGGDVALANAYADAARQRVAESGLRSDPDSAYVVVDADRLVSDVRWAAGLTEAALTHLHVARETYDSVVDGRLAQPGRLSPALLQRLSEPLFVLYRDLADRLLAVGEVDLGLVTRRQLIDLLAGIAPKDETARVQLAGSLADLVRDLRAVDRTEEAEVVAEELSARPAPERKAAAELSPGLARGTSAVRWEPLDPDAAYAGATAGASTRSTADEEAALQQHAADRLAAERREAHRLEQERLDEARREAARRETERAEEERRATERAQAEQAAAARRELERIEAARVEAERLAAEEEAERLERRRRREERMEEHRLEAERLEAERIAAERAALEQREAERRAADPAEIERLELERLQAELAELERAEAAERAEAERAAALLAEQQRAEGADRERAEAELADAEQAEQGRVEAEWLEGERRARAEAEQAEAERTRAAQEDADRIDREREEAAARAETEWLEGERLARERAETDATRETVRPDETDDLEPEVAEPVVVQPAEAQTIQPAAVADQPVEPAPQDPSRVEPAPPTPEPVAVEPLPVEPVHEAEPVPEPVPAEPVEDDLASAYRRWQEAKGRGDRKEARALNEQVVELLRPRAEQDLAEYGPRLLYALEELSGARLRGGDLWGSRAPAKEAKTLAKTLGRR